MNNKKLNEEIDFVARHYEPGAFNVAIGLRRAGIRRFPFARRVVAAAIVTVALTATASFIYFNTGSGDTEPEKTIIPPTTQETISPQIQAEISLDNASLPEIIDALEKTYGVTIENVPIGDYTLTIRYKGTAEDALETINTLLGTEMTIRK